ncbi:alpha/beta hydrolase-fold protein [Fulvivirgaceae bacterium BMA10]|uniref:Alpha/beta hydrolase-fold protein n=1 Tax=Splendidivirga corallicola TaxID=3051826 RepID=A0ABT8KHQ4_9BACT|nr:alpha/beta hydrolase-fold protein [Fulvivirgaceae bacterium BMA10]
MKGHQKIIFILLAFIVSSLQSIAQEATNTTAIKSKPFISGITYEINSKELGEKRLLNIYLPTGYKKDSMTKFPVIYLLDGSVGEDFLHITGLVEFMSMYQIMPRSIVVGIANVDRKRDFTHPSTDQRDLKGLPTSGGSARFIKFLEKEVQPFVEGNYRTAQKTIIGQSLGGLLATEILLKKPSLFDDYIIVSPSLWWNNESLALSAYDLLKQHSNLWKNVYLSIGSEGKQMQSGFDKLLEALKKIESKDLKIHHAPFPKETHATILHRSVYRAFELLNEK